MMKRNLKEKYPHIFQQPERYPISLFGVECGSGWYELIDRLCADLIDISTRECVTPPVALQIKEKFGTLRFYARHTTPAMQARIRQAEADSATICEKCGQPGQLLCIEEWYTTLCERHAAEKRPSVG